MARSRVAGGRRARFSAACAEETTVLSGVAKRNITPPFAEVSAEAVPPCKPGGVRQSEATLHANKVAGLCIQRRAGVTSSRIERESHGENGNKEVRTSFLHM